MLDEQTFNWVLERSKCSLAVEFAALKRQAEKDTDFRNKQLPQEIGVQFINSRPDEFSVRWHKGTEAEMIVTFFLERTHILVTDVAVNLTFRLTVCLNDDGECRFQIDGAGEFKRWQVLKKALERIFFEAKVPVK